MLLLLLILIRRNVLITFESRFRSWDLVNIKRLKFGQIFRLKLVHMNFGEVWSTCDINLAMFCLWQLYFIYVPFPFFYFWEYVSPRVIGSELNWGRSEKFGPRCPEPEGFTWMKYTCSITFYHRSIFVITWASLNITPLAEVSRMSNSILIWLPLRYEVSLRCHQPKTVLSHHNSVGWTLSSYPPL